MLPLSAWAAGDGTLNNPWESGTVKVYQDGSTLHVFGSGNMNNYSESKDVPWYKTAGNIQRIVIESEVNALGANAFAACGSVNTIVLKRNLTASALQMEQSSLPTGANVELQIYGTGNMVDYDSNQAWANLKTRLSKVTVAEGVTSIGAQAFSGCTKLKSVVIPSTVTSVGKEAFANCVSLTSVNLIHDFDKGGLTIGADAFPDSNAGFSISLEITGGEIPDYASADDQPWANYRNSVTKLVIGGGVTKIGNNAFHSCSKLTDITLYFNQSATLAQKVFGKDTFKYPANKVLNVVAVSVDKAFKGWGDDKATFVNRKAENTAVYYNAQGMTVTAEWSGIDRKLTLTPNSDKYFGDLQLGYGNQSAHQLTVWNKGNVATGPLQVELSGGYPDAFSLSNRTLNGLNPNASANFTLAPVLGKGIGHYYTDVIVSDAEGVIAVVKVEYFVNDNNSRSARFVKRLYTKVLERPEADVSDEEINHYVKLLAEKKTNAGLLAATFFTCDEFRAKVNTNELFVRKLYRALLDREPGTAEVANWVNALVNGAKRNDVFKAFLASAEFAKICERDNLENGMAEATNLDEKGTFPPSADAIAYCEGLYNQAFGSVDPNGVKDWATKLTNGQMTAAQVAAGIFGSLQYRNCQKSDKAFLTDLYNGLFGRAPDPNGLNGWLEILYAGRKRSEVFNSFCVSPEFLNLCTAKHFTAGQINAANYDMGSAPVGTLTTLSDADAEAAVEALYQALLDRAADPGGLSRNKPILIEGRGTHATVAAELASSGEFAGHSFNNDEFLNRVGKALLGRSFSEAEKAGILADHQDATRAKIFADICNSAEYKELCKTKGYAWSSIDPNKYNMEIPKVYFSNHAEAEELAKRCYKWAWNVTPNGDELNAKKSDLVSGRVNGAAMAAEFFASNICKARNLSNLEFITAIYNVLLIRDPDAAGITECQNQLDSGKSRSEVFAWVLMGAEYSATCASKGFEANGINPAAYDMG